MNNKKHRDNLKLIKENSTFVIQTEPALNQRQEDSSSPAVPVLILGNHTKNINFTDQVTRHGYIYRSCDELGDLFRAMFPDSKIAEHYQIERTKLSLFNFSWYWTIFSS
jgi:hypothetical protein